MLGCRAIWQRAAASDTREGARLQSQTMQPGGQCLVDACQVTTPASFFVFFLSALHSSLQMSDHLQPTRTTDVGCSRSAWKMEMKKTFDTDAVRMLPCLLIERFSDDKNNISARAFLRSAATEEARFFGSLAPAALLWLCYLEQTKRESSQNVRRPWRKRKKREWGKSETSDNNAKCNRKNKGHAFSYFPLQCCVTVAALQKLSI